MVWLLVLICSAHVIDDITKVSSVTNAMVPAALKLQEREKSEPSANNSQSISVPVPRASRESQLPNGSGLEIADHMQVTTSTTSRLLSHLKELSTEEIAFICTAVAIVVTVAVAFVVYNYKNIGQAAVTLSEAMYAWSRVEAAKRPVGARGLIQELHKRKFDSASNRKIFKDISGGSNGITVEQFIALAGRLGLNLQEEEMRRVYQTIDDSNSGIITEEEFIQGLGNFEFLRTVVSIFKDPRGVEWTIPDDYNYSKPSFENYALADISPEAFVGELKNIRNTVIDLKYHGNYIKERQLWQDKILAPLIMRAEPQAHPWLIYTCGPMGVGKGHVLSWMSRNGYFPLENIVHVDPDHFKSMMPEFSGYAAVDPVEAGTMTHRESNLMSELAQEHAMRQRQHVWVDGSLRDGVWFSELFGNLRKRFPDYSIAIISITADEEIIRSRIAARAKITGRNVPERLITDSLEAPDKSLRMLVSKVDFLARITNNDGPRLVSFEEFDHSGNFEVVRNVLSVGGSANPRFPQSLAPMFMISAPQGFPKFFSFPKDFVKQSESLVEARPIEVGITRNVLEHTPKSAKLVQLLGENEMKVLVLHRNVVTMDERALIDATIPRNAKSYSFSSGLVGLNLAASGESGSDICQNDPSCHFLLNGGYLYFDSHGSLLEVKAIVGFGVDRQQFDDFAMKDTASVSRSVHFSMLQFAKLEELHPKDNEKLSDLGRWQPVPFRQIDNRMPGCFFSWINADEILGTNKLAAHGGFAFQIPVPTTDGILDPSQFVSVLFKLDSIRS